MKGTYELLSSMLVSFQQNEQEPHIQVVHLKTL